MLPEYFPSIEYHFCWFKIAKTPLILKQNHFSLALAASKMLSFCKFLLGKQPEFCDLKGV